MNRTATMPIGGLAQRNPFTYRATSVAVLLGVLGTAIHAGALGAFAPALLATQVTAGGSGMGWLAGLSCVACIAGFILGAGTTIAGLAAFLAVHPELAILCVSTCANAVS
ncbi:MAG: hypothetical protein ACHQQR_03195 [Gemmatimonadales bacterium]